MSQAQCEFDYSGSRVLVTGGSNGIGREIASHFKRSGAEVLITGTRPSADDYEHDLSGFEYHSLPCVGHLTLGEPPVLTVCLGRLSVWYSTLLSLPSSTE